MDTPNGTTNHRVKVRLEIPHYGSDGYHVTVSEVQGGWADPNMEQLHQLIKQAVLGLGYHPDTVSEYFDQPTHTLSTPEEE